MVVGLYYNFNSRHAVSSDMGAAWVRPAYKIHTYLGTIIEGKMNFWEHFFDDRPHWAQTKGSFPTTLCIASSLRSDCWHLLSHLSLDRTSEVSRNQLPALQWCMDAAGRCYQTKLLKGVRRQHSDHNRYIYLNRNLVHKRL